MEKQIINQELPDIALATPSWLDLEHLAQIELTSEDEAHPIELSLTTIKEEGWRAAQSGKQTLRFVFDEPQNIRQIQLLFREEEQARTQEFLLRWLPAGEQSYQEIVRQQYNFSPPHTTEELEDYTVDLQAVKTIELIIIPDLNKSDAYASLEQLQLR